MKALEYYTEAMRDPVLRRQRIEDACYHKKVTTVLAIVNAVVWIPYLAYGAINEHRWPHDASLIGLLFLSAMLYEQARTKLVVLEAMDSSNPHQPPLPTQEVVANR